VGQLKPHVVNEVPLLTAQLTELLEVPQLPQL
jgi:hypothetical protein